MSDAERFLSALYAGQSGVLELRTFDHPDANKLRDFVPVTDGTFDMGRVDKFLAETVKRKLGAFFGVALRTQSSIKAKKGDAAHVQTLTALFVDADFKHLDEAETRRRIAAFPLPPSAVVFSGGGLHPYWFVLVPFYLKTAGEMTRAKSILRRLAAMLADVVDEQVSEPVRVLRVPGGANFKYDPPRPVTLESCDGKVYSLDEIEAILPPEANTASTGRITIPETIDSGDRHGLLFKLLRSQKLRGVSYEAALACCKTENRVKCQPPIDEAELETYLKRSWDEPDRDRGWEWKNSDRTALVSRSQINIRLALEDMGVELSFDTFAAQRRVSHHGTDRALNDTICNRLYLDIEREYRFSPPIDYFYMVVHHLADLNGFHPVRNYLAGLTWDGVERLDRWLVTSAKADDTPYVRAVSSLVLVAAVRRVRRPGCKFDELLVLESGQGLNKSTAIRTLCPDESWFSDDLPLNVDSKQVIERTNGKWIIEAAELSGMRQSQTEHLKAMLSRQVDGPVRMAYARTTDERQRQFIVIGTTNDRIGYLKDPTGGRRFWPVRVDRFDTDKLNADRDQLWAEAAAREATGASIRMDPALWEAAGRQQESRRAVDPWEDLLVDALIDDAQGKPEFVEAGDVWNVIGVQADRRDSRASARISAIMQRLGYPTKRKHRVSKDRRVMCWLRDGVGSDQILPEVS